VGHTGIFSASSAQRVVSTPISESTIMGAGPVGAGRHAPITEMRIFDFVMRDGRAGQPDAKSATCSADSWPAVVHAARHGQSPRYLQMPGGGSRICRAIADAFDAEDTAGLLVQAIRLTILCCSSIRKICSGCRQYR
jgi:hypothetical protein